MLLDLFRYPLISFIYLGPNCGGGKEDNGNSFKTYHVCTATLRAPNPVAGHHQCMPLPETPGPSRASLRQSLVGSLLLSPGSWCTQGSVCALQEPVSPVLCKFWWPYGGVNGDLLQEGLCHTQVCCIQSPCPCSRPLLTRTSAGDIRHSSGSVSVGCLDPGVWILDPAQTKFV